MSEEQISVVEEPTNEDLKKWRKEAWVEAVEAELQPLIVEASRIRQIISTAKTTTKKRLFQKKFNKIQTQILSYLDFIQKLKSPMLDEEMADGTSNPTSE